jgi:adenosylcobinamide hydrolase
MTAASNKSAPSAQTEMFEHRVIGETLVVSFLQPVQILSWAILNGGFRSRVAHLINHCVKTCSPGGMAPETCLRQVGGRLGLKGTVVGMMTAADIRRYAFSSASYGDLRAYGLATAGCSNLATVGQDGSFLEGKDQATQVGTINLIVAMNYGFTHEAMLEAVAIATEAKVKALYELGFRSATTGQLATGTGTDCVGVAVGSERRYRFCGKHTKWGELIGRACLETLRGALRGGPAVDRLESEGANQ